ncbi:hypothetical protein LOTGIDRAFT_123347, partial [Lottia gigantea]
EIRIAINDLKLNKATGIDNIPNEILIYCKNVLMSSLIRLFNNILDLGCYPSSWNKGCIIPVFKKGDVNNPDNYRGITLVGCIGKLFTLHIK